MKRTEIIRVSSKGQIVLPKRYRDKMGLGEGDYVTVCELDDGILLLEKTSKSLLEDLTAGLRAEAKRRKFTREELESEIKARRSEHKFSAA